MTSTKINIRERNMILNSGNQPEFFQHIRNYKWKVYSNNIGWININKSEILKLAKYKKITYKIFDPESLTLDPFMEIIL